MKEQSAQSEPVSLADAQPVERDDLSTRCDYRVFLNKKSQAGGNDGFKPIWMPSFLFDFQAYVTDWGLWKGRGAEFLDCGMGKTPMKLVWAENVVRHTNRPVLDLNPLGVVAQTIREAEKFGIDARRSSDGKVPHKGIVSTNYEQLHKFDHNDFAGCMCDESSILKSSDGVLKHRITEFMKHMRYRLLLSATPAPNDYIELGTSSEALGYLGYVDMLNRFFINDQRTVKPMRTRRYAGFTSPQIDGPAIDRQSNKWRFKGHAEEPFWKYICYWSRSARRPADLGPFKNGKFILPKLTERVHMVEAETLPDGMLFPMPAEGWREQRAETRRTIEERCTKVAELCAPYDQNLIFCHLNPEGDTLEKFIPGSVQISGRDSDERKEEVFLAFQRGQIRDLISKPKIAAWGLNFQSCRHVIGFPSHSWEQYRQWVARCHRYGQEREVISDLVTTEGGRAVIENQLRKARQAERMFDRIVANMNQAANAERGGEFAQAEEIPAWL